MHLPLLFRLPIPWSSSRQVAMVVPTPLKCSPATGRRSTISTSRSAEQSGRRPELRRNGDGSIRTRSVGQVSVPEVNVVRERDQIALAFQHFTAELKQRLVEHPSTTFFVYRSPRWRGLPIIHDANGQRLQWRSDVGARANPQLRSGLQSISKPTNGISGTLTV